MNNDLRELETLLKDAGRVAVAAVGIRDKLAQILEDAKRVGGNTGSNGSGDEFMDQICPPAEPDKDENISEVVKIEYLTSSNGKRYWKWTLNHLKGPGSGNEDTTVAVVDGNDRNKYLRLNLKRCGYHRYTDPESLVERDVAKVVMGAKVRTKRIPRKDGGYNTQILGPA